MPSSIKLVLTSYVSGQYLVNAAVNKAEKAVDSSLTLLNLAESEKFMSDAFFTDPHKAVIPIYIARPKTAKKVLKQLPQELLMAAKQRDFKGSAGQRVNLRAVDGTLIGVLFGAGAEQGDDFGPMQVGTLARALPKGDYKIAAAPDDWPAALIATAWGLGAYKFTRYLKDDYSAPRLYLDEAMAGKETQAINQAINNGRDLINVPAGDMGPEQLHKEVEKIANQYGAKIKAVVGDELLEQNYPMIHAVGRAGPKPPRLVEFIWGDSANPRLALVGKGITFDTGGVNMKSAAGARIMKKDMGGAAHALTLAQMIMANDLPVHLHVLIAVAENSVSANAFRPGDILPSRAGLTVEIDNTDAEGRLVLGDALCKANEDGADHIIDFATLTGAARVALGPTLPPFFSNRAALVAPVLEAGRAVKDPVWNMPLWQPYMKYLSSPIADMKNAGGSFAGSVTAALFLERFVDKASWMHFDVYGWNPTHTNFGRAGGEIFAVRGLYEWIKTGGLSDLKTS